MPRDATILITEALPPAEASGQDLTRAGQRFQREVSHLVTDHGGEVFLRIGRGLMARFGSVEEAVDLVSELVHHPERIHGRFPMRFRAALHQGPLSLDDAPIASPEVITARQLLQIAGPGEVVVSESVRDALASGPVQTTPIATTPAHRLHLSSTTLVPRRRDTTRSGWLGAAALLLFTLALVGALATALLLH